MLFISSRAKARSLAVMALAAVPLVAPVAANAAMGGANPPVSTATPNLRSASIQNVNAANQSQDVEFCFDKAIGSQPQVGNFAIGDYDRGELFPQAARQSSANCAVVTYNQGDIDAVQFTYGTALGNAVIAANGQNSNQGDSVALVGSTSNAGTRGVTTAPDLTGVTFNNANNTVTYTFDQKVRTTGNGDFKVQTTNGQDSATAPPANVSGNGTTALTVGFGNAAANQVNSAVRATVSAGTVRSIADPADVANGDQAAPRPGTAGSTDAPDLQQVNVSPSGTSANFVYDQPISAPAAAGTAAAPKLITSDGQLLEFTGIQPVTGNSNTVTYTLNGGNAINEFFVSATSPRGAVQGANAQPSTPGNAPVGGNAGALSSGFTTAPDAVSATFDSANNVVNVVLDQRVSATDSTQFSLTDNTGARIANTMATRVSIVTDQSAPQRVTLAVQFNGGVSGARAIRLGDGAVTSTDGTGTGAGFLTYTNPVQALSPVGTVAR